MALCFAQVLEICPYYFALEDKFLEQAGIEPSTTTDELFDDDDIANVCSDNHIDNFATGINFESSVSTEEGSQKQSSDSARISSNTPKSTGKKKTKIFQKGTQVEVWQSWMGLMLCW
jgi:hypothetical protein